MVKDVTTSHMAVGKFGHKAQVPSLKHFAADAYLNEMGITTPFFPTENCPQGDCSLVVGCRHVIWWTSPRTTDRASRHLLTS